MEKGRAGCETLRTQGGKEKKRRRERDSTCLFRARSPEGKKKGSPTVGEGEKEKRKEAAEKKRKKNRLHQRRRGGEREKKKEKALRRYHRGRSISKRKKKKGEENGRPFPPPRQEGKRRMGRGRRKKGPLHQTASLKRRKKHPKHAQSSGRRKKGKREKEVWESNTFFVFVQEKGGKRGGLKGNRKKGGGRKRSAPFLLAVHEIREREERSRTEKTEGKGEIKRAADLH